MPEENGTTPEQPQPAPGQVAINVTPQGMVIQIMSQPINLVIDENGMQQMVTQWLAAHPDLFDEIVKSRVTQKKAELAIIRNIKDSRLN
jgi:hypothetical protein